MGDNDYDSLIPYHNTFRKIKHIKHFRHNNIMAVVKQMIYKELLSVNREDIDPQFIKGIANKYNVTQSYIYIIKRHIERDNIQQFKLEDGEVTLYLDVPKAIYNKVKKSVERQVANYYRKKSQ
jgi:hypothetical protein